MKLVQQVLESKGTNVYGIAPDATVFEALREMADKEVGALMVLDGGYPVGVISERDYARKVILLGKLSKDLQVREIMSREVRSVSATQNVHDCMTMMTQYRVRHLAVRDANKVVGVISIGDIVKAIIEDQESTIKELEDYITGAPSPH